MITISVIHSSERIKVSVKGHAGYELDGKDVVCAGVSALAQGVLEYLQDLRYVSHHEVKDGLLVMTLVRTNVALHMVRMLVGACKSIGSSYPGTIKVKEVDEFGD